MASYSKVLICNMALSHIGGGRIESIDEASKEASECRTWYDLSRQQALEGFNWNFARKTQVLALHSDDAPEPIWYYRYQVPSDFIAARGLVNPAGVNADAVPFEILASDDGNQKTLCTNLEDAALVYTFDQTSTAMFSAMFVTALSHILAANICYQISGKESLKKGQIEQARAVMYSAPAHSANQGVPQGPRDAEWIRGRS